MSKDRLFDYAPSSAPEVSFYLTPQRREQMYGSDGSTTTTTGFGDAGERWDAEDIDRIEAIVKAGLPGKVVPMLWFDIPDKWRRQLRVVIDRMPDKE